MPPYRRRHEVRAIKPSLIDHIGRHQGQTAARGDRSDERAGVPMPARPSAGPGNRPAPRVQAASTLRRWLVSAGCRMICRAVRGGIGGLAGREKLVRAVTR